MTFKLYYLVLLLYYEGILKVCSFFGTPFLNKLITGESKIYYPNVRQLADSLASVFKFLSLY